MAWSHSTNEENYHGRYDTREEAIAEAACGLPEDSVFWIGECVPPPQPEDFWDANDWLERVACQDAYSIEAAEGWDDSTKEQIAELEAEVRPILAAWLDRHNLRPEFFLINVAEKFVIQDGVPVPVNPAAPAAQRTE